MKDVAKEGSMYMVWLGTALVVMKWLEIEPVNDLSWWWVLAPLGIALVWFEGAEKLFGRDRRQVEMADYEKQARERVTHSFKVPGKR